MMLCSDRAEASDFWDEVRNPGLAAHRSHVRKGLEALSANRHELALSEADLAVARCSGCADGHVLRGRALAGVGRWGEATAAFERALSLRPEALDTAPDALAAALCALLAGRPELASKILTRTLALQCDPVSRGQALAMLADSLQMEGPSELKRALATYGEAMRDEEARKRVLLGLALALHRSGDSSEALSLARRASDSETNAPAAWLPEPERAARLALWLTAIGDHAAADRAWLSATEGGGPWREHAKAARTAAQKDAGQR